MRNDNDLFMRPAHSVKEVASATVKLGWFGTKVAASVTAFAGMYAGELLVQTSDNLADYIKAVPDSYSAAVNNSSLGENIMRSGRMGAMTARKHIRYRSVEETLADLPKE